MIFLHEWWIKHVSPFLERRFAKILEINRRYAKPQIPMTRNVKIVLLFLRLYLILLVIILAYKFVISLGTGFL